MKSIIWDVVSVAIMALVIFFGLQFTVQRYVVDGPSMQITLHDRQQLLVNKFVYYLHEPERGDVVVFQMDSLGEEGYIKRIIGLPGESVEIKDGVVYIHEKDGSEFTLDEPYVNDPARIDYESQTIPENNYFVMGDNRNNSSDSRGGWTLPRDAIIGKAWLSLSFDSLGVVDNHVYAENQTMP